MSCLVRSASSWSLSLWTGACCRLFSQRPRQQAPLGGSNRGLRLSRVDVTRTFRQRMPRRGTQRRLTARPCHVCRPSVHRQPEGTAFQAQQTKMTGAGSLHTCSFRACRRGLRRLPQRHLVFSLDSSGRRPSDQPQLPRSELGPHDEAPPDAVRRRHLRESDEGHAQGARPQAPAQAPVADSTPASSIPTRSPLSCSDPCPARPPAAHQCHPCGGLVRRVRGDSLGVSRGAPPRVRFLPPNAQRHTNPPPQHCQRSALA